MNNNLQHQTFLELINSDSFYVDYDVEQALLQEGLKKDDYIEIVKRLHRPPNRTELGMFGVMWSEHCCYRNSKPLLNNFPTTGDHILVGPGENAGVVDLGDGQRLAFKIESHNHPSAVEPFQGAATGVGGILRDIFTMGARPIALLNSLRFGPLENEKNISLFEGVVSGIAHYGNCVGVPTVGGEVSFDNSYSGNPLVNAMALGLLETDNIVCSGAKGINYPVLYVGSTTGRDGMGGASFASAELSKSSIDDRPAVQVGDPFLEKGLIEGCLEAFKTGNVVAAQDMGAAGLTCSCAEMAAKGNVGIELNLDLVPAREDGMTPYEYLLSESQERMLFVIEPGKEKDIMNIFLKWGLNAVVVGKVLPENIIRVLFKDELVVNLPAIALAEDTPIDKHQLIDDIPKEILNHWKWSEKELPKPMLSGILIDNKNYSWNSIILKLLDDPSIASKRWVYNQYDHQVQNNTIISPGKADAAVIRLRPVNSFTKNSKRGIAAVVDCPNRWVSLDPERGSIAAVAEASRNLSCVGAKPLAITDNLNFSSPNNPIGYWQLSNSCKGLSKACQKLNTPVTGGNVSLFNEIRLSNGQIQPIQPTPVVGMVGLIDNIENVITQSLKKESDTIWLLGTPLENLETEDESISLSASSYLQIIHGLSTGRPPKIDLDHEKFIQQLLRHLISKKIIRSAHDISDGGLALALAESCIASNLGIDCRLSATNSRLDRILFAEGGSRVIISISPEDIDYFKSQLKIFNLENKKSLKAINIGRVNSTNNLYIKYDDFELVNLSIYELRSFYENAIPRRMRIKE